MPADLSQHIILSPDLGGLLRARQFSENLNLNLAVINKSRDTERVCHMSEVIGDIKGKHCILIDDIVDTAGTLCQAAKLLIRQGALSIEAYITHGVLSGEAVQRIQDSTIQQIFITDSIVHGHLPQKFKVISIVDLLCKSVTQNLTLPNVCT